MLVHQTRQTDNPSLPFISQTSFTSSSIFVSKPIDKLMTLCYTVDRLNETEHLNNRKPHGWETQQGRAKSE